jgi:hypothetical protein
MYIVTGHANGCILWNHMTEQPPPITLTTPVGSVSPIPNNSYCPPCEAPSEPQKAIALLSIGKIVPKQRKLAVVAVTASNEVLMLRDRGRHPLTTQVDSLVLHVYHENRQARRSLLVLTATMLAFRTAG